MNTLINICGTERTGSTMFDLILGNDPDAFSLGEVNAWFRPFRTHHFDIKCSCGKYPCPKWELVKALKENQFHKEAFRSLGVKFLIDSSKELSWVIDNNVWAKNHNSYVVYNFLVYKQPVSFALSHWKRKRNVKDTLKSYKYYERFLKSNLSFFAISYEELIDKTDVTLKAVCDLTGMNYSKNKKNFWEKEHHHLFGSFGARKQVFSKSSTIYKEKYPKEFEKLIPRIKEEFGNDKKVKKILENLRQNDIKCQQSQKRLMKIRRGSYYYYCKIKSKIKKHFPDRSFDKEANLLKTTKSLN